jgi:predicted dithiol-disulfide oxidoreductase (DUF899 family)
MTMPAIGTREEWFAAREELLVREKEHTRLGVVWRDQHTYG